MAAIQYNTPPGRSEELSETFRVVLSGREEVPPVRTAASGNAFFRLSRDGTRLTFRLSVCGRQLVRD
ncbi:CHRD domain-containing protein [Paenibacillus oceani]|uniref:CHRD domain-containing protein n=1 Tax=Paenibacillus oceani TaxID=2772510 RepID=A0A927GY57_9BACL|nr:CHRD domain-containing protein [Paenibacillus oceani]MBD2861556.1 CHRD domain-containing protein [Paenibacillus oceani]